MKQTYIIVIAIVAVCTLTIGSAAILSNSNAPTSTQNPTSNDKPTSEASPPSQRQSTLVPEQNLVATISARLSLPTFSMSLPDEVMFQNVAISVQQDEDGNVIAWVMSGYLADTTKVAFLTGQPVVIFSGEDSSITLANCVTDSDGYFEATIQPDQQTTTIQALFPGDNEHTSCSSEQLQISIQ